MRKRLLATILAFTMALGINVYARYDVDTYNYRKTTDLEASIEEGKITVTWPAVNKQGELINANPLQSNSAYGNPTGGWTAPTAGMIIGYPNWQADGTVKPNNGDKSGNNPIYRGFVSDVTDYPVAMQDPKDSSVIAKDGYIDTTVVSADYASAYRIYTSTDNVNWKLDHDMTTVDHGKKFARPNGDGTYTADRQNTFFLEDQYVEQLVGSFEADTTYYIKVVATCASKLTDNYKEFTTSIKTEAAKVLYPAFPTVEGSGIYAQGGRGTDEKPGDVYVVTNLTDSVSDPQPGSLRYGLLRKDRADGNSLYPRTIVFAVDGVIDIDPTVSKSQRRFNVNSNTTIAGQTAPGEGVTIRGGSVKIDGSDIIVRYLRINLGEGYDQDAATATGENIVVDHCSFMWGVDECFTAKEIINSSIQYNIIATSLGFPDKTGSNNSDAEIVAGESEAKHGMGSILNGYNVSYTHNLWANHGTRNPRFEGEFTYKNVTYGNLMDFSNNVIYNWGHNSGYGGERGNGTTNMVANYYKPGPNTLEKAYTRIFDVDGSTSKYYATGNVMTSSSDVTSDNTQGFFESTASTFLSSKAQLQNVYTEESANDAYEKVLSNVGASFRRNAQDARLVEDVRNGKGQTINNEKEAGGVIVSDYGISAPADTDKDGMPDSWEIAHGLDPSDARDAGLIVRDETKSYNGYSNIEVYCNDILGEWKESDNSAVRSANPTVILEGVDMQQGGLLVPKDNNIVLEIGESYHAKASVSGSNYEVRVNDTAVSKGSLDFTLPESLAPGTYYLTVAEHTSRGDGISEKVRFAAVPKGSVGNNLENFVSNDIGKVRFTGSDNYDSANSTLTQVGSGRIGILNTTSTYEKDAFHYDYTQVTGDFTFSARMDNLAKLDYLQKSGLMVRGSLSPESEMYMASLTYIKGEDYEGSVDVAGSAMKAKTIRPVTRTADGANAIARNNMLGIAQVREGSTPNHGYGKIERKGNTINIYGSLNGTDWYELYTWESTLPEKCYIGFATDAAQDYMELSRMNATLFSEIAIEGAISKPQLLLGDVNSDLSVDSKDASLVLQHSSGAVLLEGDALTAGDVNFDSSVDSKDASLILQYTSGSITSFK